MPQVTFHKCHICEMPLVSNLSYTIRDYCTLLAMVAYCRILWAVMQRQWRYTFLRTGLKGQPRKLVRMCERCVECKSALVQTSVVRHGLAPTVKDREMYARLRMRMIASKSHWKAVFREVNAWYANEYILNSSYVSESLEESESDESASES